MATNLRLDVVGEGPQETVSQVALRTKLQCKYAQGFTFHGATVRRGNRGIIGSDIFFLAWQAFEQTV